MTGSQAAVGALQVEHKSEIHGNLGGNLAKDIGLPASQTFMSVLQIGLVGSVQSAFVSHSTQRPVKIEHWERGGVQSSSVVHPSPALLV